MSTTPRGGVLMEFTLFYEELPSISKKVKRLGRKSTRADHQ